jgi:hypothetical protein
MSALGENRTLGLSSEMSALCQKQTYGTAAINAKIKRGSAYRQLGRLIAVWTKTASRRRGPLSNRPPVSSARSHGQQLAYYENENGSRSNGSDHHQFALE